MLVPIHREVFNKFREWSSGSFRNDTYYDMKVVQILLIHCLGSDKIHDGIISEKVKKFITGEYYQICILLLLSLPGFIVSEFLRVRTRNNQHRVRKMDEYIAAFIKEKRRQRR